MRVSILFDCLSGIDRVVTKMNDMNRSIMESMDGLAHAMAMFAYQGLEKFWVRFRPRIRPAMVRKGRAPAVAVLRLMQSPAERVQRKRRRFIQKLAVA